MRKRDSRIEPKQLHKTERTASNNSDISYPDKLFRLHKFKSVRPRDKTNNTDSRHSSQTSRQVTLTPDGSIKITTNLETACQDISDQFVQSFNSKDNL